VLALAGLIEIPTAGVKNSLNVASACAVAAFEVVRQWRAEGGRCGACGRGAADQAG
jgi:tRNA(Leu) C34 or U34 (ribose-2'-O)-methylase TrmL